MGAYGNYRNKMIKSFVFVDNIQGFLKWCRSIRRIKFEVTVNKVNKRYDMYYGPNFWGETKRMYLKTMKVIRHFNDTQQHYINIYINHRVLDRRLAFLADENAMYLKWRKVMFEEKTAMIRSISKEEVGIAIKEARLKACKQLLETAQIVGISANTLRAYESGKRMLPFDIYYKLNQFLDIKLKYLP